MKFQIFGFLSAACFFLVKSDSISEFKKVVEEANTQILGYEEQFFASIIVMLSNLKDASTEINSKAWSATIALSDNLKEKVNTKEQTDCIASGGKKFYEKVQEIGLSLDPCVHDYKVIGDPIRKKFQAAYEETVKIREDLDDVKNNCSAKTEKPEEECISLKVNDLEASLKNLLEKVRFYNFEADTIKPKILSESLYCNAKVLSEVPKIATDFQDIFKKCAA